MAPNIEIQLPYFVFYPVDECEKLTVQRAVAVVSQVFQLAFAAVCDELILQELLGRCIGCTVNHPSEMEYSCLMVADGEAWFHYFDQAIDNIDLAHVMTIAENVYSALGFKLDNNWEAYLSELTKLPKTAMYLAFLELKNQSGEVAQAEELKDCIICAIYYGPNGLKWNDFSHLKSARYSNQELLEVKPMKDSCAGTTGTRKELSVEMDFVINEIKNKLRF